MKYLKVVFFLLSASFLFSGCGVNSPFFVRKKNVVYFQDAKIQAASPDTLRPDSIAAQLERIRIQPFDVLDIKVAPAMTALGEIAETKSLAIGAGAAGTYFSGFFVDGNGNVTLPKIGEVSFKGLTIAQAKELLKKKFEDIIVNPYVEIKFLTFRVTVLGAVASPGTIVVSNEKATLIDIIGQVGDLADNANPKKIMILRGPQEKLTVYSLDLTSVQVFKEAGFRVMPNDIIYVEPSRRKFAIANLATGVSFLTIFNTIPILVTLISRI
jgi:polysaccharide export outer membrane protein